MSGEEGMGAGAGGGFGVCAGEPRRTLRKEKRDCFADVEFAVEGRMSSLEDRFGSRESDVFVDLEWPFCVIFMSRSWSS